MPEKENLKFAMIFDESDVYFSGSSSEAGNLPIYGEGFHEAYFATEEDMNALLGLLSKEEQRER